MNPGDALDRHAARVRQELDLLDYPRRPWMPTRDRSGTNQLFDVLIVGAGQGAELVVFAIEENHVLERGDFGGKGGDFVAIEEEVEVRDGGARRR